MLKPKEMREALSFFQTYDRFLMLGHTSPDGDTVGSCLALAGALRSLGKTVQTVNCEPVPEVYRYLTEWKTVVLPENCEPCDAVITVDCADLARCGSAAELFRRAAHTLCIDHHGTNCGFAEVNLIRGNAAAAGELVYCLIKAMGAELTKDMAEELYTAIATDTGNFSYSNTTEDSFLIASKLMKAGLDLPRVNRAIYRTVPYRKLALKARAFERLTMLCGGRVAVCALTLRDVADCGAVKEDIEGLIDDFRDIDTAEAAAVLKETAEGTVRVSLRGKTGADVSSVAKRFGGGGHRLSAGCTLNTDLKTAEESISAALTELMEGLPE